jgi:anti-anti-sigma factor
MFDGLQTDAYAEGRTWVIVASGELDIAACDAVDEAFSNVPMDRCDRVVVDARGLQFLDASGVRALLDAAAASGVELWLRAPSDPVRLVIELSGLAGSDGATSRADDELRIA